MNHNHAYLFDSTNSAAPCSRRASCYLKKRPRVAPKSPPQSATKKGRKKSRRDRFEKLTIGRASMLDFMPDCTLRYCKMRQRQVRVCPTPFPRERQSYKVHADSTNSLKRPPRANPTAMNQWTRPLQPHNALGLAQAEKTRRVGRLPRYSHLFSRARLRAFPRECSSADEKSQKREVAPQDHRDAPAAPQAHARARTRSKKPPCQPTFSTFTPPPKHPKSYNY